MPSTFKSRLDEMKEAGIMELPADSNRVELILYEGATYKLPKTRFDEEGWGDRPLNIPGFEPTSEMTNNQGDRFIGYVAKYENDHIFLSGCMMNNKPVRDHSLYFHQDTIHSFQKIGILEK
ncbi:MAG: hypothetical protein KKB31_06975 [Nanoarchaeota archaeon]|nr:hypothetical protein [Nanoarchaeota archaeon]